MRFWQEVDGALVRLAASKADKVRDALANSINAQQVADDFLRSHPADTKITPAQARDWARLHVTAKTLPLLAVIREAYAEAYALGQDAALSAYAHARLTKAADTQPSGDDLRASMQFDWSKWKPGNRPASLLLSPPNGLKNLLSNADKTIKGMTDTSLNRIGTILGDALGRGRGSDVAARSLITDGIEGMLTSASRAQTIAVTEMARATQVAQMDSYRDYGIEYVEWVDIDADDDCATNAEQGPIPLGQEFDSGDTEPPAHPNCRCAIVPAFPDDAELPPLADETTAEAEVNTDHSDAIAQGIEAVATELHPDLAVETTSAEAIAEGRTISTPYEVTNEVWKPIVERFSNAEFFSYHQIDDEANVKLKETIADNLSSKLQASGANLPNVLGAMGKWDDSQIQSLTESTKAGREGLQRFNMVSIVRGETTPFTGFGRLETALLQANPELAEINNINWVNQVTEQQFQKGLELFNSKYSHSYEQLYRAGTPEANAALWKSGASDFVKTWATTSNNENALSLAIQQIASDHFGLTNTADWQMQDYLKHQVDGLVQQYGSIYKTILDAQYETTQTFFKEQGIKEIALYRGVRNYVDVGSTTVTEKNVAVTMRPLSSFSTNPKTAMQFAGSPTNSAIFRTVMPVEKILSMPGTGFGCYQEYEMVVLGGTTNMDVAERQAFEDFHKTLQDPAKLWEQNVQP